MAASVAYKLVATVITASASRNSKAVVNTRSWPMATHITAERYRLAFRKLAIV